MEKVQGGKISLGCGLAIGLYAAAWGSAILFTGGAAAAGLAIFGLYGGALSLIACATT